MEDTKIKRNKRSVIFGTVISDKMAKTRIVKVQRTFKHPIYEKVMRRYKKYYVHDELEQSKVGDEVLIMSTRPISKLKRWRIYKIVNKK